MKRFTSAALAVVLAAIAPAASQPFGSVLAAEQARSMSSLSAQEREQLPDRTNVTVRGKTTTLGTLRAAHRARLQRFANASALGKVAGDAVNQVAADTWNANTRGYTLVIEPPQKYSNAAQDMKDFCNAAKVTVCLYIPASAYLSWVGEWPDYFVDIDYLITDPAVCAAGGGHMQTTPPGCLYAYPQQYIAQFYPGAVGPYTHAAKCNPKYWDILAYDSHGAVDVEWHSGAWPNFEPASATCLVRVWTKN